MHRREALAFLGTAILAPLVSPLSTEERYALAEGLHARIARNQAPGQALTAAQMALVTALADTILPRTDTPGALDVSVPAFVDLLVAEWYGDDDRDELLKGLDGFDERCRTATGKNFADLTEPGRADFLATIDGKPGAKGSVEAGYRRLKSAIVYGYVTSEQIGTRLATMPIIPGRFDGCIPAGGAQ
jgi:gluconate 2-dehydrogenase gamma chain